MTLFACVFTISVPQARADTPNGTTKVLRLTLDTEYNTDNTQRYQDVITQLRQAAGQIWTSGDVYRTQTGPAGLIALRILQQDGREQVTLYLNPNNLYIGGFRTRSGELYAFSDASPNVRNEMSRGGPLNILDFGGSYTGLRRVINQSEGYGEPRYANLDVMSTAAESLGGVPDRYARKTIAVTMMFFTGAFSEGARFTVYRDAYSHVMNGHNTLLTEISNNTLQQLRAHWPGLSRWMQDVVKGLHPAPYYINPIGTFRTYGDARVYLRTVLAS
jgi:hypothetical protein